jgi:hypothetical protein
MLTRVPPIDLSAAPSLLTTTVCSIHPETFPFLLPHHHNHFESLQSLMLHRRRMQRDHAILSKMHQVPSGLQRPRMSQSFQIIPLLPYGPVRTHQPFRHQYPASSRILLHLLELRRPLVKQGSRGSRDTNLSKCYEPGSRDGQAGRQRTARERCCSLHSLCLVRSETSELSNRHSSSLRRPLSAQDCLEQHTCSRRKPHPHFLLSHGFGSIRMGRSTVPNII